jgi:hypothetical protein
MENKEENWIRTSVGVYIIIQFSVNYIYHSSEYRYNADRITPLAVMELSSTETKVTFFLNLN